MRRIEDPPVEKGRSPPSATAPETTVAVSPPEPSPLFGRWAEDEGGSLHEPTEAASPADAVSVDEGANAAPPIGDGPPLSADGPAPPQGTGPAVVEPPPVPDGPAGAMADDAVLIPDLAAPSAQGDHPQRSKKKGRPTWLAPITAALGVTAVVLIASIIHLASQPKPDNAKKTLPAGPGPKVPVLTIDWPENQRAGASLRINDVQKQMSLTGPIAIPLPPSDQRYKICLRRRGFQDQTFYVASREDDVAHKVAEWDPVVQGLDWGQDFAAAKTKAAQEHKNVLVFFDASDSKEGRFASSRFVDAVAKSKEFRERAGREYVCVYIDNPQGDEAKRKVDDADRNQKLIKLFRVKVFPTVVVTDPRGRQFGILEDYKIGGITAFLQFMDKWAADGKYLFELLATIDAMPKDNKNAGLIAKFFDFLEVNELDRFYRGYIKELTPFLPEGESRPVTEDLAAIWRQKFLLAGANPDAAKNVVDKFDQWKKTRTFKDPELGAETAPEGR